MPELEINTFWTSLRPTQVTARQVVELYHEHGTSEQFHSELKTDLERLPSGKFATNAMVLECGLVAYNALRLCGQESLRLSPSRRRRVGTTCGFSTTTRLMMLPKGW